MAMFNSKLLVYQRVYVNVNIHMSYLYKYVYLHIYVLVIYTYVLGKVPVIVHFGNLLARRPSGEDVNLHVNFAYFSAYKALALSGLQDIDILPEMMQCIKACFFSVFSTANFVLHANINL